MAKIIDMFQTKEHLKQKASKMTTEELQTTWDNIWREGVYVGDLYNERTHPGVLMSDWANILHNEALNRGKKLY